MKKGLKECWIVYNTDVRHSSKNSCDIVGIFTHKDKMNRVVNRIIKQRSKESYEAAGYDNWKSMHENAWVFFINQGQTQHFGTELTMEKFEINKQLT